MKNYQSIFNKLDHLNVYPTYYHGYADPAEHLDPEKQGIITGNWNNCSVELATALEEHFDLAWEDDYSSCSECGLLVRTSPSSYDWTPSYHLTESELICESCLRNKIGLEYHIEDLLNNPTRATTIMEPDDMTAHGFRQINSSYESGLHLHQTDKPTEILKKYSADLLDNDYLFRIADTGQFDITFELWIRPKNYEHAE